MQHPSVFVGVHLQHQVELQTRQAHMLSPLCNRDMVTVSLCQPGLLTCGSPQRTGCKHREASWAVLCALHLLPF